MNRLTLTATINGFTGYGLHAIQIARDISALGHHVSIRAIAKGEAFGSRIPPDIAARFVSGPQPEKWELLLHPPVTRPTPGKKTAYFTMWESTRPHSQAKLFLNSAQVVIVPCKWNASIFSAIGVEKPIRVVPLGVNENFFSFRKRWDTETIKVGGIEARCVFGAAGRLVHGGIRKGVNEVIDCFKLAFPTEKDVVLRVKGFPDCAIQKVDDPRIEVRQEFWSEQQLSDWFMSLNSFVSLARGEGWGLMQHQAMAIGRPVISMWFGGVEEFLNPSVALCPRFKLAPSEGTYRGGGCWAVPNRDDVIDLMRWVYTHPQEADDLGVKASESVAHLTWMNANKALVEVLQEFGAL